MHSERYDYDQNLMFVINKNYEAHQKKLNEIKQRKTFVKLNLTNSNSKKMNTIYCNSERDYRIDKDNKLLFSKILSVQSKLNPSVLANANKLKAMHLHKRMKEMSIQKENLNFFRRMNEKPSSLSFKKLDTEYNSHVRLVKSIQKIKNKTPRGNENVPSIEKLAKISSHQNLYNTTSNSSDRYRELINFDLAKPFDKIEYR